MLHNALSAYDNSLHCVIILITDVF